MKKFFVLLHIAFFAFIAGCFDEANITEIEEDDAIISEITCEPQEPINKFPSMFIDTVDIVLEPPDIPENEFRQWDKIVIAPVVIPRGTLFIWHDNPTGGSVKLWDLHVFGVSENYNVRAPDNQNPFKGFTSFRDDRLGQFHGRYFAFRYGRPRLPDVTAKYINPHFEGPLQHKSPDTGELIPAPDQYAVIYDGKIYRDSHEGDRRIYALEGIKGGGFLRFHDLPQDVSHVLHGSGTDEFYLAGGQGILEDIDIYDFVQVRIDKVRVPKTRQSSWGWFMWVLVGKADIAKIKDDTHGYTFCLMNFTFDTSERIGELNHPWHIVPPTPYFPEEIDFRFESLYE